MGSSPRRLTPRQLKFVERFSFHGDPCRAALECGYSKSKLAAIALVQHKPILGAIHEKRDRQVALCERASPEDLHKFWFDVMRDPAEKMELRLRASENEAKTQAMFIERKQVDINVRDKTMEDLLEAATSVFVECLLTGKSR